MPHARTCPLTGKPLDGFHGNRKLHPDAEKLRKKLNNKKRYRKIKEMDKKALRLDAMLEHYYDLSKGNTPIDKNILLDFSWDFVTKITGSANPIFWILDYGYSYSDNKKKIIIHDGTNI
jgi:hypothetical protein